MSRSARTVRVFAACEAVSRAGAELFVAHAAAATKTQRRFRVALAGGSTPRRLYELLASEEYRERVAWPRIELFWGDERSVPPDHPESNFRMARESLLDPLGIPTGQVHRMKAEECDAGAPAYEAELASCFGVAPNGAAPCFDLILLGMGPDGHTASLFPHTAALGETHRWVVCNAVPQKATRRLTFTATLINAAACVLFLVCGADKAGPLAEVLDGPPDPERLPAQRIAPLDGELIWYVDREAGGRLKQPLVVV